MQLDGVRRSFHEVEDILLPGLRDSIIDAEDGALLVVKVAVLAVHVLGLARAGEISSGKAYDMTEPVLDGNHQTVAVEVVDFSPVILVEQTHFEHQVNGVTSLLSCPI